nr:MAG TPA: hypothetical protein [Caudoviricetes sp.]
MSGTESGYGRRRGRVTRALGESPGWCRAGGASPALMPLRLHQRPATARRARGRGIPYPHQRRPLWACCPVSTARGRMGNCSAAPNGWGARPACIHAQRGHAHTARPCHAPLLHFRPTTFSGAFARSVSPVRSVSLGVDSRVSGMWREPNNSRAEIPNTPVASPHRRQKNGPRKCTTCRNWTRRKSG